jgi:hypothetical protein
MAKGQKRSGREPRKPRADRKPASPPVSPFSQVLTGKKPASKTGGG